MKRKYLLTFIILIFLILISYTPLSYCSLFTFYNIETHDNPFTNYSLYRSFGFYEDDKIKLYPNYLPNKHLQKEIIQILEEKGYKYKENFLEADLVIFLFSSNEFAKTTESIPIYQSNNKTTTYSGHIGMTHFSGNVYTFGSGSWTSITVTKNRYYPYVYISFLENLSRSCEKVWEGAGFTSTRKSDIEKYGSEIVKRILKKFPEMSYVGEGTKEIIKETAARKENENINYLIDKIKEKDKQEKNESTISKASQSQIISKTDVELAKQYNFRKTNWGMNQTEVIQCEENVSIFLKDYSKDNILIFQGYANGIPCYILYEFANGKLTQTAYWFYYFDKSLSNKNDYISEYSNLKENLTKKYGTPLIDQQNWNNNLYRNDSKNWGLAISLGHLNVISRWETADTEIELVLWGKDDSINLSIVYTSKELKDLIEKIDESNKSLEDF